MKEEEKKKHLEAFDRHVKWLRECVPPDDIYDFAEQALVACDYFIKKIGELTDIEKELEEDPLFGKWINNVVGMRVLRDMNSKGIVNTEIKFEDVP